MTLYVDPLMSRGWCLRGHKVKSCHLFADTASLADLHALANAIGCSKAWFQDAPKAPHYDLTAERRHAAIACGALQVTSREAVEIWRRRRERVAAAVDRAVAEVMAGR